MDFWTSVEWQGGDYIFVRGVNDEGRYRNKVKYSPTLFHVSREETQYKNLKGQYVEPFKPGSISEARKYITSMEDVVNAEVYGFPRWKYQFITERYPGTVEYDASKVEMWSLDIETTAHEFPNPMKPTQDIILITAQSCVTKEIIVFGWYPDYVNERDDVTYIYCATEKDLLELFVEWWASFYPDILTGWNVDLFDISYICARLDMLFDDKYKNKLSPFGKVKLKTDHDKYGHEIVRYEILGVNVLDYMEVYKCPSLNPTKQERYTLDYISEIVLKENKVENPYPTFQEFVDKDPQLFVDYNIRDVELVSRLEDKLKMIDLLMLMAYDNHACYEDGTMQVRAWDIIIYNFLHNKGVVTPMTKTFDKDGKFEGGYVKAPISGRYEWVVSYDMTSLYPSIIRALNVSPETLTHVKNQTASVESILDGTMVHTDPTTSVAANGATYMRDVYGMMPEIVTKVFNERKVYKGLMSKCIDEQLETGDESLTPVIAKWDNWQKAKKVNANALFGACGNQFFRYYEWDNAEAITLTGRTIIKRCEVVFNEVLNQMGGTVGEDYVIAIDTDSVYLNLGKAIENIFKGKQIPTDKMVEVIDQFCKNKFSPIISEKLADLAKQLNVYENTFDMKRECIAQTAIWTGKKHYMMTVWDEEGHRYRDKPKLKVMGIQCVQSSTPKVLRTHIKEAIWITLTGTNDDLIKYVEETRKEFMKLPLEDIAFPRTANAIAKYKGEGDQLCVKSTPMASRAALLFNKLIVQHGLSTKYPPLTDGAKFRLLSLRLPNPTMSDCIGFLDKLPEEFDLERWVDRYTQFEKGFIVPINAILDVIGWTANRTYSLFD